MKFLRSNLCYTLVGCFMAITLISCGYLLSVPQLRDADDNSVVNLGDSIFALSGDIYTELHAKAGQTFRHYAVSGTQMIGGILGPPVPDQYQTARSDDPAIDIVYMDGGGNDILLPAMAFDLYNCKTCDYFWCELSQTCKDLIDDVYVEVVDLLNEMAQDGVQQVVYLGYYSPTQGIFGDLSKLEEACIYGNQIFDQSCAVSNLNNCVFVDPTEAFKGNESAYITSDGIHPTEAGSKVLADMIWEELAI